MAKGYPATNKKDIPPPADKMAPGIPFVRSAIDEHYDQSG